MAYIKYINNGTKQCPVDTIYYDITGISQSILDQCIQIDILPDPQAVQDKRPVLYCDPVGKTVFYGYVDIPIVTTQADLNSIKVQNAQLTLALVKGGLL